MHTVNRLVRKNKKKLGVNMEWYPESGEDIDESRAGHALLIESDDIESSKNSEDRRAEAKLEEAAAEEIF